MPMLALHLAWPVIVALVLLVGLGVYMIYWLFVKMGK